MDERTIKTQDGTEIKWLPKNKDYFLDKVTLIIGGTGSGKTTIIQEILYLIKDDVPITLVVANEISVKAYVDKVPIRCISKDITKTKLTNIWKRQSHLTQCYEVANNMQNIENLFNKIPSQSEKMHILALQQSFMRHKKIIESDTSLSFSDRKSQAATLNELYSNKLKESYKSAIRKNYLKLQELDLTTIERNTLEYLDVNPRLVIILDDVSDKFKCWMNMYGKNDTNIFKSIFFQGRHNYITVLFAVHADSVVVPELRNNSRVTIFTSSSTAMTAFSRTGAYSTNERKLINSIAPYIYDCDSGRKSYQKLCYIREDPYPIRYTIANLYPDFKLGCQPLMDLINRMPKKKDNLEDNPYIIK